MPFRRRITITQEDRQPIKVRLLKILDVLNVVPLVFFKLAADYAVILVEEELRLERYCRLSNNFTDTECDLMEQDNFTYVKTAALSYEESFIYRTNLIQTLVCLVVVSFAVSWSDRHGRIQLLRLSIVGYFFNTLMYLLFISVEGWPVEVLLIGSFFKSLAGGSSLFTMAIFSMMVDKSDPDKRTLGLGILTNMIVIGQATGYIAGLIVKAWGDSPFWVVFVALLLYIISMLITIYLLKEDPTEFETRVPPRHQNPCIDLMDPRNVSDLFSVPFRQRKMKGRLHLLMILWVTFFVLYSPPYFLREWTTTFLQMGFLDFTILSTVSMISCQVTTMLVLRLTRKKPVHDCLLATIAEGMTAMQDFLLVSVTSPELLGILYLSAVFSVTHNLSNVGIRAALAKLCDPGEIGRVYGIMAFQEIIMTWVRDLVYHDLWDVAQETLPTAHHLLSACFATLNALVLLTVFLSMKKTETTPDSAAARSRQTDDQKNERNDKQQECECHDNLAFDDDGFNSKL